MSAYAYHSDGNRPREGYSPVVIGWRIEACSGIKTAWYRSRAEAEREATRQGCVGLSRRAVADVQYIRSDAAKAHRERYGALEGGSS